MAVFKLTETAVKLVLSYIETNIVTELAAIAADRADYQVNLDKPQRYFTYETEKNYRKPAIFCIVTDTDFELIEGANHINALHRMYVSCVVEDRTESLLVLKAWRYQAALCKLLHLTILNDAGNKVRIIPKVTGLTYSPMFTEDESGSEGVFCKEMTLEMSVEHYEQL